MTERYDHRSAEVKAENATEDTVGAPVMDGATDLRREAQEAIETGEVDVSPKSTPGSERPTQRSSDEPTI